MLYELATDIIRTSLSPYPTLMLHLLFFYIIIIKVILIK